MIGLALLQDDHFKHKFLGTSRPILIIYHISSINAVFLISIPLRYYLNTNNIDIVIIFISSTPLNSTACHFVALGITANYCVKMIISLIVFEL